jgi:hypothetical protein
VTRVSLDQVFAYFREYDRSSFEVFACQGNEPSEDDIAAFEASVGFVLPGAFRQFTMSPLGGLYMAVKEDLWPRPKLYDVGPFWSFLYGLKVFGIAEGIPDVLDIRVQAAEMKKAGFSDIVPFFQRIDDANKYCFNQSGQIIDWDHEVPDERRVIDEAFPELLLREIRDLESRKDMKLRGEDKTKPTGELRPEFQKSYEGNKPCPHCGKPLRSNQAKQCFDCGADWH